MTREIKFRAWCKKNKVWQKRFNVTQDGNFSIGNGANYSEKIILMQYTGLHDKNGVEIYDGDIVFRSHYQYEVQFIDGAFMVLTKNYGFKNIGKYTKNSFEVIGNIYQNKNLLT